METVELNNGVFRLTALSYLNEALFNQEFEKCKELIEIARKLGVPKSTIDELIASYLKGGTEDPYEADINNRLHILKEE